MPTFGTLAAAASKIDINAVLDQIFTSDNIERWVVDTIQNRIYDSGITGSQTRLKTDKAFQGEDYSKTTLDIKSYLNQRIDNVTLKDSGDYYNSMRLLLVTGGVEFAAEFQKKDGHMSRNFTQIYGSQKEFESDVMSLTESEMDNMIRNMIIPKLLIKLRGTI